jgi:hypothetical protein
MYTMVIKKEHKWDRHGERERERERERARERSAVQRREK